MNRKKINLSNDILFGKTKAQETTGSNPLIKAASVLGHFTMKEAMAWGDIKDIQNQIGELRKHSKIVKEDPKESWYTLDDEVRKKYLSELVEEKSLQKQIDLLSKQKTWNDSTAFTLKFLRKEGKPLGAQTMDELAMTLRIAKWVNRFDLGYPTPDEIYAEMSRKEFIKPLMELTQNFQGRGKELEKIQNYVDWLPSRSILQKTTSFLRNTFSWHQKKPMLISGIGGIGKSTLVAKFILDHTKDNNKLPFIYIDFDNTSYSIREPLFILLEAFKQLKIQFPKLKPVFNLLINELNNRVFNNRRTTEKEKSTSSFRSRLYKSLTRSIQQHDYELSMIDRPILAVFDSFEELQYRGANRSEFYNFLDTIKEISELIPRVRPIFAGRAEIEFREIEFETIKLESFDNKSSDGYLRKLGVANKDLRTKIFQNFGGNPLTLQLASTLAKEENLANSKLLATPSIGFFFQKLDQGVIQKELVKRNLDHIHDPEVRKIAMPGLLVRKVNAEIIQKVLAGPCGLGEITEKQAIAIYKSLKKETFLIQSGKQSDGVVFRPELRKAMEELVFKSDTVNAEAIHDNAIEFYDTKKGPKNRAEYIYHRLKRGDDPSFLNLKTYNSTAKYLDRSLEELPLDAQVYIAALRGSKISKAKLKEVKIEEWEKYYVKVIRDGLRGDLHNLLEIKKELKVRSERSFGSPLAYWEARLFQRLNKLKQSDEIIDNAIQELESDTTAEGKARRVGFALLRIENLEYKFNFEEAYSRLDHIAQNSLGLDAFKIFQQEVLHIRLSSRLGISEKIKEQNEKLELNFEDKDTFKYYESYYQTDVFDNEFPYNILREKDYRIEFDDFQKRYSSLESLEKFATLHLGGNLSGLTEPGEYEIIVRDIFNRTNENILAKTKGRETNTNIENLTYLMADLYPSIDASKKVLLKADIYAENIVFEYSATRNWTNILHELQRINCLDRFMVFIQQEFPKHEELRKLLKRDYQNWAEEFSKIYPSAEQLRSFMEFAGFPMDQIEISPDIRTSWFNVVNWAENTGKIDTLIQALVDKENDPDLYNAITKETSITPLKDASNVIGTQSNISTERLKSLLAKDRLKEVLDKLSVIVNEYGDKDLQNSILMIAARLKNINSDYHSAIIDDKNYNLNKNRLRHSILNTIEQIENSKEIYKSLSNFTDSKIQTGHGMGLNVLEEEEFEQITKSDKNITQLDWMSNAIEAAKSVCQIKIGNISATGFLIEGGYVMTAHHVICKHTPQHMKLCKMDCQLSLDCPLRAHVIFGGEDNNEIETYELDPAQGYFANKDLDYALIKVKASIKELSSKWGFAEFISSFTLKKNDLINIIQHPGGAMKKIALPDKLINVWPEKHHLFYLADTKAGASGSPIYDQNWKVIGIHQQGSDQMLINEEGKKRKSKRGTLISAIYEDLNSQGFYGKSKK